MKNGSNKPFRQSLQDHHSTAMGGCQYPTILGKICQIWLNSVFEALKVLPNQVNHDSIPELDD